MQARRGIQNTWAVFFWDPVEDLPPFQLREDFVGVVLGAHVDARHPFVLLVADSVDRKIPPEGQKRFQGEQMGWDVSPTVAKTIESRNVREAQTPKPERARDR